MDARTRYARSGELSIAYQLLGDGPLDLVYIPSWVNQIEHAWALPDYARFLRRLASFSRLITLDKRGLGLSDRVPGTPTLEDRIDDLRAVLDAVGSTRAALFGSSEGGTIGAVFAATYPERSSGLILHGSFARIKPAPDYPWGWDEEFMAEFDQYIDEAWGTGEAAEMVSPSNEGDQRFKDWYATMERLAGTPGAVRMSRDWNFQTDIRDVLPTIRVPTLVLHRAEDWLVPVECGRYLGDHIAGARYVELPGGGHYPYVGDADAVLAEVEEFLTGARPQPPVDRVLATVLFTDVVASTERAADLGDRAWRELLDRHDALVREQLSLYGGREVKTTGDGVLATFDGPARAVRCARAIVDGVASIGLELRAGVHCGECELRGEDVSGIAVHIGARVAALAGPGEVFVSSTVKDLVAGSGLVFADQGQRDLKGVPGSWHIFSVEG